ncbi:MAG: sigma-54 interaction domain-containing protein [Eubacteriaceae bacterium]
MKEKKKISVEEALDQGYVPIEALELIEDLGVFILNKNEEIICYSKGCEKIDGYTHEMVYGKHPRSVYNIIHPLLSEDREDAAISLTSLREGKTYVDLYDCYQTSVKKEIDVSNSGYPIKNEKNEVVGSITVYQEVSEYLKMVSVFNTRRADSKYTNLKLKNNGLQYAFEDIIGNSMGMQKCIAQARICADTQAPVLIYGETGTGKEVFSQSIHNASDRKEKPFVAVNCSAIPVNLLESTLFGTVKSAFTGAADTPGLFSEAEGGTLFLDELNSMDINVQSKLLRVLETGHYRKVGSTREIKSNVRVISALNQDPFVAIEEKRLRSDLYYRLAIFVIHLPPLRERKEDILVLSESFISNLSSVLGKKVSKLSQDVLKIFKRYHWAGNIRELKHVITQSLYMAKSDERFLKPHFLPQYLLDLGKITPECTIEDALNEKRGLKERMEFLEKQLIDEALNKTGNNISKAARDLKISRENLRNKLKKYNQEEK